MARTVRADGMDLFGFLAQHGGQPRHLYVHQGEGCAGAGAALELSAQGPGRFGVIELQARAAATRIRHEPDPDVPAAVGPRFLGGFAFAPGSTDDAFPDAHFVLPERLLTVRAGRSYLTTVGGAASSAPVRRAGPPLTAPLTWTNEPGFDAWANAVREALEALRRGSIEKVVLARTMRARLPEYPRFSRLLRTLAVRSPRSYLFLVEPTWGTAFLGATPELLVRRGGGRLQTAAIAGSRPRGRTDAEDEALGRALLASSKEAWEHELVARFLRSVLARRGLTYSTPIERGLLRLPNVQHLQTLFDADADPDGHVLRLANELHPTPAVGGSPREAALPLLTRLEARSRSWYAGPVGWFDLAGDGEFVVAIRSATVRGNEATLWAGCGIVEGSDPAEEWAESRAKFQLLADGFELEASP